MKLLITIIFYFSLSTPLFSQIKDSTKNATKNELIEKFSHEKLVLLPNDTLNISIQNKPEKLSSFNVEKNMPWIGAIIIGLLTVLANYVINKQIRETNTKSLEKQLKNAKDINQMDFNKTVLSGNRQAWINDLRDTISKVLSKTLTLSLKKDITHEELHELMYLITKTELMLNPANDKDFIYALKELEKCFIDIKSGKNEFSTIQPHTEKVKLFTKKTLKTEWERVKKGE